MVLPRIAPVKAGLFTSVWLLRNGVSTPQNTLSSTCTAPPSVEIDACDVMPKL